MRTQSFRELFVEARQSDSYWEEHAALDFTEAVYRRMTALGLTKSQLAERLGTSPAYVTKILGGEANFTLKTMVRLARALEAEVAVHLEPKEESAAEAVSEKASAVAETGSDNAYGGERKKRARASAPSA